MKALIISIKEAKSKKKKTESSYEYYVHYEKFNRRMDEWVVYSRIQLVRLIRTKFYLYRLKKSLRIYKQT